MHKFEALYNIVHILCCLSNKFPRACTFYELRFIVLIPILFIVFLIIMWDIIPSKIEFFLQKVLRSCLDGHKSRLLIPTVVSVLLWVGMTVGCTVGSMECLITTGLL